MILGFEISTLLVICLAFTIGGFIKGIAAFGLPLVTVPILSNAFPVPAALALTSMPILLSNSYQILKGAHFLATLQRLWPMLVCLVITLIFSTQLLVILNMDMLGFAVGLVLLLFVGIQISNFHMKVEPHQEKWIAPLVGIVAGVVGGMTSIFGAIPLTYIVALKLPKERFVAATNVMLLSGGITMAIMLAKLQVLNYHKFTLSLIALIPMFIGLLIGQALREKISQAFFHKIITAVLAITGLSMIIRNFPI